MNNIYLLIPELQTGHSFAIATVIETKGSTPQKSGSSALFDHSGLISGTIGGGVLEGKVQQIAKKSVKTKESGIHHFDLDHDISFKQDAICGGNATVLVDASTTKSNVVYKQIKKSLQERIPGILVTIIQGCGVTNVKISRYWINSAVNNGLPKHYADLLHADVKGLLSSGYPGDFVKKELFPDKEKESIQVLMEPLFPPSKLIIAGAGHIGRALAHLGKLLDFEVTVIDDRAEYANSENIPDADHIIVDDIGKSIKNLEKYSDTYIVIVTRGHDNDASALRPCINSGAAYVGMIGSKIKIAQMHRNFIDNGWATEDQWSAIHAPIGLEISSKTVEEIAVSIAAQLVLVRNSNK
jgi:xanthine dehydrogenase accessory factor